MGEQEAAFAVLAGLSVPAKNITGHGMRPHWAKHIHTAEKQSLYSAVQPGWYDSCTIVRLRETLNPTNERPLFLDFLFALRTTPLTGVRRFLA